MSLVLPERFDASFICKAFYPQEWKDKRLSSINMGKCYDWAYKAFCLWLDVELWTTENHAWVKCGDLFFDSEALSGSPSVDRIPCNVRCGWDEVEPTPMDAESFKDFWNVYGGGRRHHWNSLADTIRSVGLNVLRT